MTRASPRPQIDRKKIKSPTVTVVITDELIYESSQRNSSHCMISEAVRNAMPTARRIATDLQTIRFTLPETGYRYIYLTPRVGQEGLIKFDQGIPPEPFKFQLRNAVQITYANKTDAAKESLAKYRAARREREKAEAHEAYVEATAANTRPGVYLQHNRGTDEHGRKATVIGGTPLPVANLSDRPPKTKDSNLGKRREFGLAQLKK